MGSSNHSITNGGSRHSVRGAALCGVLRNSDGMEQFNMFPSIKRLFICWRGANSIVTLNGVHSQICSSLDPPLSIKKTESEMQKFIQVVEDNRKRLADSHKNTLVAYALGSHYSQ